ncbi:c-type cytochrome biogenesis protein CcsB [Actinocorallia sp. A-T 12471]|uniref:c-type cytochrome biogenesis protein CcsB n=1 Tax=Actinocorallia sp. A-T 12471 TaxID=3089813 RepID=UPI0029D31723|nr:c-type cytochrome biogenesis protein CcsB [Actinocorallia sp. A-T 12471]MDX6741760.1 c-type cytochrome biogenesis protein CcsB [Actinocorallia sp. A-T 12471]
MVDADLAGLSNNLVLGAVLLYVVAMFGYAADLVASPTRAERRALVGAGAPASDEAPEEGKRRVDWGRFAVLITCLGWLAHAAAMIARGVAVERWPWANMYEFVVAICLAAVTAYLVLLYKAKARFLGAFVMVAVVIGLGAATIWLYQEAGAVVPALESYWIAIHVSAAIIASGGFTVGCVASVLYLAAARREAAGPEKSKPGLLDRLPSADVFDGLAYKSVMFVFPIWTFAIIAGAIWADSAWGRYWGWDPKETWSFIVFAIYAGYLHARATAGWKGKKAAAVSLVGYAALLFNLVGVNIFFEGLHSYSGM